MSSYGSKTIRVPHHSLSLNRMIHFNFIFDAELLRVWTNAQCQAIAEVCASGLRGQTSLHQFAVGNTADFEVIYCRDGLQPNSLEMTLSFTHNSMRMLFMIISTPNSEPQCINLGVSAMPSSNYTSSTSYNGSSGFTGSSGHSSSGPYTSGYRSSSPGPSGYSSFTPGPGYRASTPSGFRSSTPSGYRSSNPFQSTYPSGYNYSAYNSTNSYNHYTY
ncbi:hypothetical protein SCHPADRAFT_945484 [Schizopora paradoxa]|uniref:Uncharacterized protein n=1 Tax=Schizopora paradoxa TaxID=27342 RepID=A0A0H2R5Z2_9AGAM|nr:hypothetical protein SCHPADRAFT_945484 [Schizopora paradoxa]